MGNSRDKAGGGQSRPRSQVQGPQIPSLPASVTIPSQLLGKPSQVKATVDDRKGGITNPRTPPPKNTGNRASTSSTTINRNPSTSNTNTGGSSGGSKTINNSKGNNQQNTDKNTQSKRTAAVNNRLDLAAKEAAAGNLEGALNYANAANNLSRSKASKQNTANIRDNLFNLVQKQRQANVNPVYGPKPEEPKNPTTSSVDIPITPTSVGSAPVPSQTLMPGRDVVNFAEVVSSPEAMQQILFEELSSFELVNMARGDTVEGLNPYYSVISNLSSLRRQYNPSQIISLQTPIQTMFDIYQINLIDKIPDKEEFFSIDINGDFVIELDNMNDDEVVEIQIATSGKII